LLHPGINTIAVALKNVWAVDWDDVAFDLDLKAVTGSLVDDPFIDISTMPLQGGANASGTSALNTPQINLQVSVPPNTVWRIESAESLTGPWQLVDVVSNTVSGLLSVIDTGQNGRLPPSAVSSRYYRIVPN
jgi:hypothetical protein